MAYDFFPKSVDEITKTLSTFPVENVLEIVSLFSYLRKKEPSLETPINIDKTKKSNVNVSRSIQEDYKITNIVRDLKLSKLTLKFGNGSSGNRGVNNRGNLFEPQFANALLDWWAGEKVSDKNILTAIEDLDKTYNLKKSKKLKVEVLGELNTKRPLEFIGGTIKLKNPKGTGNDVGKTVTDITLTTDTQRIYLSLKLGTTTTFFNVGVKTILTTEEIKAYQIKNKNGLQLLDAFGIDVIKFCQTFNQELPSGGYVDKTPKYNKSVLKTLLESGIGMNYHIIHKLSGKILSKKMDDAALQKASTIGATMEIYYGGMTGNGRRIDMVFQTLTYKFKLNIRDTQGKDGYPTRLMCDFSYL